METTTREALQTESEQMPETWQDALDIKILTSLGMWLAMVVSKFRKKRCVYGPVEGDLPETTLGRWGRME